MGTKPNKFIKTTTPAKKTVYYEHLDAPVGHPDLPASVVANCYLDVTRVQQLFNYLLQYHYLRPFERPLDVSGKVDGYTLQVLELFQRRHNIQGDERNRMYMSPQGETLRKLNLVVNEVKTKANPSFTYKGRFHHTRFFQLMAVTSSLKNPSLGETTKASLSRLLKYIEDDQEVYDLRWMAYMLATVKHETKHTYEPIYEDGGPEYCKKYDNRADLENGPHDGYLFRGRGYAQLTGRKLYRRMSALFGGDLENNPDNALDHDRAYKILSYGMRNGSYTGVKLSDFIQGNKCNFVGARKIVNGTDKDDLIANYANAFLDVLLHSMKE